MNEEETIVQNAIEAADDVTAVVNELKDKGLTYETLQEIADQISPLVEKGIDVTKNVKVIIEQNRWKSPVFWVGLVVTIGTALLASGIAFSDLTGQIISGAVSLATFVLNALNNPSSKYSS